MACWLSARLITSYAVDYFIVVGCIVGFTILDRVEPYHQPFSLNNILIQYPLADTERVTPVLAAILCVVVPAGIIFVWAMALDGIFSHRKVHASRLRILRQYSFRHRLWELNAGILGLLLSVSVTFVITGALKNTVGKPRPDLIARCLPRAGAVDTVGFGLVTSSICTQGDNSILKDGFRSFPSGHSSTAFAGLGYLTLFLAGRLHIFDNRGEVWRTALTLTPLIGASVIAATRIMDARHHGFDVVFSSFLGILVAWGAYRQYYPPLHLFAHKGRAFEMRSWGNKQEGKRSRAEDSDIEHGPASGSNNGAGETEAVELREQSIKLSQKSHVGPAPGNGCLSTNQKQLSIG